MIALMDHPEHDGLFSFPSVNKIADRCPLGDCFPTDTTHHRFPPIDDYGFLSDCENTCLISSAGAVEWMCLPYPDSASVFGAILDRHAGYFFFGPSGVQVPAARRYIPGEQIIETTWQTPTGWLIVREGLVMAQLADIQTRLPGYHRTPRDWAAQHVLVRTAECISGTVDVVMTCAPRFDYGRLPAHWCYSSEGYSRAQADAGEQCGDYPVLNLDTNVVLSLERGHACSHTRLEQGQRIFVALRWAPKPVVETFEQACQYLDMTGHYWRQWLTSGKFPDHRWRSYLQRSALTLKGLSYAPTGALLAASTTSLPESYQGQRNWDYRYSWIRDSTFALWGLYTLGFNQEARDFFSFITDVCETTTEDPSRLQVMYGVDGRRQLDEYQLDHLGGYRNCRPVRIGNDAYHQHQHDIWGTIVGAVYLYTKSQDHFPDSLWSMVRAQVEQAILHWSKPDCGIWEVRGAPKHFTSSKIACWVALDRGARLAELRGETECARRWDEIAAQIKEDVLTHGVDARGVLTQSYGSPVLDASVLLAILNRFLPPDDPRAKATVLAIAEELTEHGLVLRYHTEETDDGLETSESPFTICSFWLVSALVEIGELARAQQLCEKLLSLSSPLQLYAEEIDGAHGAQLGNFPQAFTHLGLINAVVHVIRAEEHHRD